MRHETDSPNHDPEPLKSISARHSGAKCGSAAQNSSSEFLPLLQRNRTGIPGPKKTKHQHAPKLRFGQANTDHRTTDEQSLATSPPAPHRGAKLPTNDPRQGTRSRELRQSKTPKRTNDRNRGEWLPAPPETIGYSSNWR